MVTIGSGKPAPPPAPAPVVPRAEPVHRAPPKPAAPLPPLSIIEWEHTRIWKMYGNKPFNPDTPWYRDYTELSAWIVAYKEWLEKVK